MKKFSDFDIKAETKSFSGDKITIDRILNREVVVRDYKIEKSKFEGKGNCLYMQIELNGMKYVVFTGSAYLMEQIQQIDAADFPFSTTIVKIEKRFLFS